MNVRSILDALQSKSVLVVGDICLDLWCTYDPEASEPSRETGLHRVAVVRREASPGAAGTVSSNLVALGVSRVAVLGVVGNDGFGFELVQALSTRQISAELLYRTSRVSTFTYTKLLNARTGDEDLPRVDFVFNRPLPEEVDNEIVTRLRSFFESFDVIVVADQAETQVGGVVTPALREELSRLAAAYPDRVVIADSRARLNLFRNVVLKPNLQEAENSSVRALGRVDFEALRKHTCAPFLFVTKGEEGCLVVEPGKVTQAPSRKVRAVDICGAGDAFAAGSAVAYAVTRDPVAAAHFGNLVAGVTVTKKGTGIATPEEVLDAARETS